MKAINNALAVAWNETQVLFKDRGALMIFFLLPLIIASAMGGANLAASRSDGGGILLKVGLVNLDDGLFGQNIAGALDTISALDVTTYATEADAQGPVARGEATAAIVIPAGFSGQIDAYTPTQVEVIVDPGQPQAASIVSGIVNQVVSEANLWGEISFGIRSVMAESIDLSQASPEIQRAVHAQSLGAIMTALDEARRTPPIAVVRETDQEATVRGGIESFFAYLFPGIVVMFIFFGVTASAPSLIQERETGTMRRLLAAPIPRGAVIAGKMLAYVLLGCLQVLVMFLVGGIVFHMPLGNSPFALVIHTVAVALASASLGMMVAALARTSRQASTIAFILGFVLAGLGGCMAMSMTPLTRAGGVTQILAQLTPQGHGVEGFYRLMVERGTLFRVLPESGILLGMTLLFCVIAAWRFRYE